MTILQMQYYAAVCRWQNITKAAEVLHIAQPTLSVAMHTLEKETGLNLFRHVGRNIEVTVDGAALFEQVNRLLTQVEHFEDSVREMANQRNHVRIAVPSQIGTIILPLLLGEFRAQHPAIQLEIVEPAGMDAAEMVRNEEVDLAIIHAGETLDGLCYRKLITWPICLCVWQDHPLANHPQVSLEQAAEEPLVLLSRNFFMTRRLLQDFEKRSLQPEILHFSPHLSSVWNLVQNRIVVSILGGNVILPDSQLRLVPIEGLFHRGNIIMKKGRQIYQDEKCLISFLQQKFSKKTSKFSEGNDINER